MDAKTLQQQLDTARETNRKLHRRVQALEHELAKAHRLQSAAVNRLDHATEVISQQTKDLQRLFKDQYQGGAEWMRELCDQLPRDPVAPYDGPGVRLAYAVRLLRG